MKSACVGVLSIIELKNAWWNTEIFLCYCYAQSFTQQLEKNCHSTKLGNFIWQKKHIYHVFIFQLNYKTEVRCNAHCNNLNLEILTFQHIQHISVRNVVLFINEKTYRFLQRMFSYMIHNGTQFVSRKAFMLVGQMLQAFINF